MERMTLLSLKLLQGCDALGLNSALLDLECNAHVQEGNPLLCPMMFSDWLIGMG